MTGKQWSVSQPGVLPHTDREPRFQDTPQTGKVLSCTAKGVVVALDEHPDYTCGPAPWNLGAYASRAAAITAGHYPHVGDRVLVLFAGVGIGTPWVVGWDR